MIRFLRGSHKKASDPIACFRFGKVLQMQIQNLNVPGRSGEKNTHKFPIHIGSMGYCAFALNVGEAARQGMGLAILKSE